jgi:hypothetical protein
MTAVAHRSRSDIAEVERCHQELLVSYTAALADASFHRQYVARKMVEAHVKRRLEALAAIYTQTSLVDPDRERYETLACDTRAFADTLSMWRLASWIALIPIALALVGPVVGVFDGVSLDSWRPHDVDPVAIVFSSAFLVFYVGGFLPRAFWRKRALLFPDADRNAYAREAAAFTSVGRGRPMERRWDYAPAYLAGTLLVLFGPILVIIALLPLVGDARDIPVPVLLLGWIPGVLALIWLWDRAKSRTWR